jgi:hypothetical protein
MKAPLALSLFVLLPGAGPAADFNRDVRPVLARHCYSCHGPAKQRASLRLDTARALRAGGDSGPAVVPGKSADSRLIHAVTGSGDAKPMPPKGPRLSAAEVAVLRAWIDGGAAVPVAEAAVGAAAVKSDHWAFQPITRPAEPAVKAPAWVRNPIDRFVLARLEAKGVQPSPEADRATLLRRLSLDLTGLPPSAKEINEFLADTRPDAYERAVDRLLASPHYGERWGRHWLDLARYADSNGYSIDSPRSVWKYRDWVLAAFNRDLPFDRFLTEQLAGDLLPGATTEQKIATGFHRNTQFNEEGGIDLEQFRVESVIDRTNTTGSVFLGLTVGCCQCHDHKFDPLSQRDYYRLFAFFNSSDEPTLELATPEQVKLRKDLLAKVAGLKRRLRTLDKSTDARVAMWEGRLSPASRAMLPKEVQHILTIAPNGRSPAQEAAVLRAYRRSDEVRHVVGGLGGPLHYLAAAHLHGLKTRLNLEERIDKLTARVPEVATTLVLRERKTPRPTHVMISGDFLRKGAAVTPGVFAVLPPLEAKKPNRLDLARWLTDPRNPLTARVTVNRFWQQFFGTGLVETENDFGTQGTTPTHPALLDWLASEFRDGGWQVKAMHRLIVTSAAYRQSSHARAELATLDPRNKLLARQNRLRLDAEVVRDVALAASGLLVPKVGGPSVYPPQPPGVYAFTQVPRNWKASVGPERYRRGLYTFFWRSAPHPDLIVFDAPDAGTTCTRRNRSNTPLQALTLLNDQGFYEFAQALARRVLKEGPADDGGRVAYAFRLCLGRPPRERERQVLLRLLQRERGAAGPEAAAWTSVARVLLNLDEFITRE